MNNPYQDKALSNKAPRSRPSASAFILSKDPKKAMQEMLETIENLQNVYQAENEALDASDTATFLSLQDKKLEMAQKYQNGVEQILSRKEEMRDVEFDLKKRLTDMQEHFSTLAQKNRKSIERMQRATERLGNTIRRVAKETAKTRTTFSYNEIGTVDSAERKSVSMGVNETA